MNAFAVCARLRMLPMRATIHYSFFTIHCSLYPLGAVTLRKPPRGVYNECWASHAAGSRREMEAGTARWESHAAGSRRKLPAGAPRPACNDIFSFSPIALFGRICYKRAVPAAVIAPMKRSNEIFVSSPIALFGRICYNNRMYSGVCGRIIAACNPRGRKSKKFFGKGCNLF